MGASYVWMMPGDLTATGSFCSKHAIRFETNESSEPVGRAKARLDVAWLRDEALAT